MAFKSFLDLLFPKKCVSCGKFGNYLCPTCLSKIVFIEIPVCPICERPSVGGATHPGCQTRYTLDGLISACVYEGPVKAAIKRLKYRPWLSDLGETLTTLLVQYLRDNASIIQIIRINPIIVPVPLHQSRERQRGFNQAEILGRLLAQKLNLKFVPDLLVRQKNTRPQVELKGKERQENIRGAFSVSSYCKLKIENCKFIVTDDVWTTGATLRVCGQVLKRAGAKIVWGLTLAR